MFDAIVQEIQGSRITQDRGLTKEIMAERGRDEKILRIFRRF